MVQEGRDLSEILTILSDENVRYSVGEIKTAYKDALGEKN